MVAFAKKEATARENEPRLKKRVVRILTSCGIDPEDIDPHKIGKGAHHDVYRFREGNQVVKIPTFEKLGVVHSAQEEEKNIQLYQRYFGDFSVPTSLKRARMGEGYCVVMDYVEGKTLTTEDVFEQGSSRRAVKFSHLGRQLGEILSINDRLMEETGSSVDLVGLDGLLDSIGGVAIR